MPSTLCRPVRHPASCLALAVALLCAAPAAQAQMMGHGPGAGMHGHGADGTGHDEVTMPGLQGRNATPEESAELAVMFRNFPTFTREVTNLPDGIRTVTRSSFTRRVRYSGFLWPFGAATTIVPPRTRGGCTLSGSTRPS